MDNLYLCLSGLNFFILKSVDLITKVCGIVFIGLSLEILMNAPIARGKVESLCVDGKSIKDADFTLKGPYGDRHSGYQRKLSGHDGGYIRTSSLKKGDMVLNWRSWTGLSREELHEIELALGVKIPPGCLLENIIVSGIPSFSKLKPTTRLVFPEKTSPFGNTQVVLAVWEENGPCAIVGKRLEEHHEQEGLKTRFVTAAQGKRGVMGIVLSPGNIEVGDSVLVYTPI